MNKKLFKHFFLLLLCMVTTGAWAADLCSSDLSGVSASNGTKNGTNCTISWSGLANNPDVTINNDGYYKFNSDDAYVNIKLTNGIFLAGDVLSVKVTSNGNNKTVGYKLKSKNGNGNTQEKVSSTAAVDITYTLTADDINDDGSISVFRNGSNARFFSFSVTGTRGPKDPVFTLAKSTIQVGETTKILVDGEDVLKYFDLYGKGSTIAAQGDLDWVTWLPSTTEEQTLKGNFVGEGEITFNAIVKEAYADKYNSKDNNTIDLKIIAAKTAVTLAYNPTSGTIKIGNTANTVLDVTGATLADLTSAEALTYTSSDEKVATVAEDGTITAVGPGTATITASLKEDAAFSGDPATFNITVLSSNCTLQQAKFSNTFNAFINNPNGNANGTVKAYYLTGTDAPTLDETSILVSDNATYTVNGNTIIVTAQDGETTATYDIQTPEAVVPFKGTECQFDGTESWVKTGGAYNTSNDTKTYYAWVINRQLKDTESPEKDFRVPSGRTRIYFFVDNAESIKLINDRGTSLSANRNIKVYVNGVLQESPTSMPMYDAENPATITITTGAAAMIEISSDQNSGDTGWGKMEVIGGATPSEADLTLTDADAEETNKAKIQAMENKNNVTVTVDRAVTAGQWNTIYLPFAMNTDAINAAFGAGSVVAAYKEYVGGDLKFETVNETEANTAYLINPANTVESFTAENVNVVYAADKTMTDVITLMAPGTAQFYGFLDNTDIAEPAVSIYYIATGNKIKRLATTGGTLKALHGYFLLGASDDEKFGDEFGANTLSFSIDGTTTGIVTVEGGEQKFVSGEMFNLAGQRVNDSYKGVVIVNGKKVIKK